MARTKEILHDDAERIGESIREYLEDCPYDISTLWNEEDVDQLTWDLAFDKYESAMEDKADAMREEAMGL